ncbi:uncharacterized protein LOC144336191 [Macaca mulatta]
MPGAGGGRPPLSGGAGGRADWAGSRGPRAAGPSLRRARPHRGCCRRVALRGAGVRPGARGPRRRRGCCRCWCCCCCCQRRPGLVAVPAAHWSDRDSSDICKDTHAEETTLMFFDRRPLLSHTGTICCHQISLLTMG